MKEILKNLWVDYFADECAKFGTEEESALAKKVVVAHKKVIELVTKEQHEAIEKYVEYIYELQSIFAEKAFKKGCEFAFSFFFEACGFIKE